MLSLLPKTIGVILPREIDVKSFKFELQTKLDSVPEWLDSIVTHSNARSIRVGGGTRVRFITSVSHTRGQLFDVLYISSSVPADEMTQYAFTVLPILSAAGRSLITFDDE